MARTGINVVTLYRIEHAKARPQTRTLRTLLDLYGVDASQQAAWLTLLRDARQRGWLHPFESVLPEQYTTYIGLEGEACSVWNYESLLVPGLLQTDEYARAVIRAGLPTASQDDVERRVQVRMGRQDVLHGECPIDLWVIMDEAALHRQVGGQKVMREQLRHIREAADLPQLTLQVVPFGTGAHAGMSGAFVLMQFADASIPEVIYLDNIAGDLFLETDADVRRYRLAFDHLRASAEGPDASRQLITAITAQL